MKARSFSRFLIVWAGQFVSGIGTGMTAFALGVRVFEQTGSAANFAAVMLSLFLPSIIFSPVGGVLTDRFDRRLMIILGDAGSAVSVLFLLACLISGDLSLWKIYLGVAIGSSFSALQGPAYKASLSDLLTESQFVKAGGLVQLASSARHLLSPVAAGFLLAMSGIKIIFLLDIATFVFAVTAVLFMPPGDNESQENEENHFWKDIKEGLTGITGNSEVKDIVLKLTIVTFFAGSVQIVFTPMMMMLTDVKTLGTIQSISATGMLAGSILHGIFGRRQQLKAQLRLGLAGSGLSLVGMSLSTHLLVITIFFFMFFMCLPLINISAEVFIRTRIPNNKQGRTWGSISLLSQIGYLAAYSSVGFITDRILNPLLLEHGALAGSIGWFIGTGPFRGNAFALVLCGAGLFCTAITGLKRGETINV